MKTQTISKDQASYIFRHFPQRAAEIPIKYLTEEMIHFGILFDLLELKDLRNAKMWQKTVQLIVDRNFRDITYVHPDNISDDTIDAAIAINPAVVLCLPRSKRTLARLEAAVSRDPTLDNCFF